MALSKQWVDAIFTRLTVRYGSAFLGRWNGIDMELVKADWAEELAGLENWPDAIKHALDTLQADKSAPTVNEFKAACLRCPKTALELPPPPANPAFAKQVLGQVSRKQSGVNVYTDWIHRGLAGLKSGVKRSPTVERMIREAAEAKRITA